MAKTQTDLVHPTPKDFFQSLFDALALGNKSQEEYLDQFFPARLHTGSFQLNGETYSIQKIWGEDTRRSPLLNGKTQYIGKRSGRGTEKPQGNQLYRAFPGIFSADPSLWPETLRKCDELMQQRPERTEALRSLLSKTVEAMQEADWTRFSDSCPFSAFHAFLDALISRQPGRAVPVLLLTVLMGNVPTVSLFNLIQAFLPDNEELTAIAAYLGPCGKQIRHSVWPAANTAPKPEEFAEILKKYYGSYDKLYRCNTSVSDNAGSVLFKPSSDGACTEGTPLLDLLYERSILNGGSLLLTGAPGTEKHGLLHILFLKLAADVLSGHQNGFAPYLCNLWHYSTLPSQVESKQLNADFSEFIRFCREHPNRRPVVFIDGVREYPIKGAPQLDMKVDDLLAELNHPILLVDTERLRERIRRNSRQTASFTGKEHFSLFAHLTAVSLDEEALALSYLKAYQQVFPCNDDNTPEEIRIALLALLLPRVDTGQLRLIRKFIFKVLSISKDELLKPSADRLLKLYRKACDNALTGDEDDAMEWAFSFCFCPENRQVSLKDDFRKTQLFLCSHETILNYYSASYYLKLLSGENTEACEKYLGTDASGKPRDALNVVMPRSVTLFLVSLMNTKAGAQSGLFDQIRRKIDPMLVSLAGGQYPLESPKPFSQMLYLLGRMDSNEEATDLLKETYLALRDSFRHFPNSFSGNESDRRKAYRNLLYLLRSASIGLLAKRVSTVSRENGLFYNVWNEYLLQLLTDPSANELNRAFHLEYYEDRPAVLTEDLIFFYDDCQLGERTLDSLLAATASKEKTFVKPSRFYKLNLFTLASLLQARIERITPDRNDSLKRCVCEALDRIDWFLSTFPDVDTSTKRLFLDYLKMVREDFGQWLTDGKLAPASARFFSFYEGRGLRRNWIEKPNDSASASGSAEPKKSAFSESIADHELQDWLIAMLLLPADYVPENPEQYTRNAVYDKESILKLLLIHDAVEVKLGNYARFEKTRETREKERSEMTRWLLRCTYPSLAHGSLHEYLKVWMAWTSYDGDDNPGSRRIYRDVNGDVAHQIDRIQELHRLLRNVSNDFPIQPDMLCKWVRENARQISAEPYREIARILILNDPALKKVLDDYQVNLNLD